MDEEKKDIIEEGSPIKNVKTPFGLPIPTLAIIGIVAIAIIVAIIIGITGNNNNNSSDVVNCSSCGDSFDETMNFCPNCGAKKETSNTSNNDNTNSGGNNNTNLCSHNWKTATCTMPKTCSKCGETSGNALGHTWKTASCTQPKTCSKCGKNEGNALGHTATTGICDRCNVRQGWTKEEIQNIVKIHDVSVYEINSADGVSMNISWTNTSNKTIKYIHFYVEPYNAVNDKMTCDIRDHSLFDAYVTGPCEPGYKGYKYLHFYEDGVPQYKGTIWENCWYNSTIRTIDLVGIKIIYMDNTEVELDRNAVQLAFAPYEVDQTVERAYSGVWYHNDENPYYLLTISLLNSDGLNLKKDVFVDVEIINDYGVEIYSKTFEIRESDFYEGSSSWKAELKIYQWELESGDTEYGDVHCRIYNNAQGIDVEDSSSIEDLPIIDYADLSVLYSNEVPISLSNLNEGNIIVNEIYYEFSEGWELGKVHLTIYISTQRVDHLTESFEISGILSQMDGSYATEFSGRSWAYEYNETDEVELYFYNIPAGDYFIDFNN